MIEAAADRDIDDAHFLLILNRNENVIPAVAKLEGPLAAFFMLGETQGTSAGGADEAGKFLRVPGTNPFFPAPHDLGEPLPRAARAAPARRVLDEHWSRRRRRGRRALEEGQDQAFVCDREGHRRRDDRVGARRRLRLPDRDARSGIDAEDIDILQPRRLYEAGGRAEDYRALVERFKAERSEFLGKFPSLSEEIVSAVR